MSQPDFFDRPPEWERLEDPERSTPPTAVGQQPTPPEPAPRGLRRWFRRRPKHDGLGDQAAGPDFSWPAAPASDTTRTQPQPPNLPATSSTLNRRWAQPPSRPAAKGRTPSKARANTAQPAPKASATGEQEPIRSMAELAEDLKRSSRRSAGGRATKRTTQRGRLGRVAQSMGLYLILFWVLMAVISAVVRAVDGDPSSQPTRTRTTPAPNITARWNLGIGDLRPDLTGARVLTSPDASFDYPGLVDAGDTWVVLTGDEDDKQIAVHGIDAQAGTQRWRNDLPDGLCATGLVGKRVLCAAASAHDPASGLGTKWRVSLLDANTGREVRGIDFDGWLTMVHADGDRILLVEQRQPAPHAVLTVLDASLKQVSQLDLKDQPQHDGMFSDNRIIVRNQPIPEGPALDRPRIRKVADGLTALWVGQTTAFLDLNKGTLIGMPRCSRLVDDGARLWCNDGPLATAYSYTLEKLAQTELNTRLAFPYRDPRGGDVTDPVFLKSDGKAVRVDPKTGETIGPLADTRNGSAFGLVTSPNVTYVDGLTLVSDSSNVFAVDAKTGELFWQRERSGIRPDALAWDDGLLLIGDDLRQVDPKTGRERSPAYRQPFGLYTLAAGAVLVGYGPDEIARLVY